MRAAIILSILLCAISTAQTQESVGENFTLGAYYAMPQLEPQDNFSWDYAFMDMARIGCNRIVISGNCWADGWAAIKHWDMKGIKSYGQLAAYTDPWDPCDMVSSIIITRDFYDNLFWNGEHVGDTVIGRIMTDEPECQGLTEDKINFLRAWADLYHQYNPTRDVWVNHCDPPWYDFNEKQASCSCAPAIFANSVRITDRIQAAKDIGLENFTVVALLGHITDWGAGQCSRINYFDLGPCTQDVLDWLATRSNYQDAYEEMVAAYYLGALGFHPYQYNQHRGYSLVNVNGNDQYGIRDGFCDAAHDLRSTHGWPTVELFNNSVPFNDRGNYPAGTFTLTAEATSPSGTIEKIIFGKSTNGGSDWESIEDTTSPYSAVFSTTAGTTVIFRARAVGANGKNLSTPQT